MGVIVRKVGLGAERCEITKEVKPVSGKQSYINRQKTDIQNIRIN
jgi:hypothetical protein